MLLTKEDRLKVKVSSKYSTDDVNKAFAERLKALREIAGLTQSELADKLNVSRGSIGYYEKAERTPDIKFLRDTACLFGVTYDFLLGESDSALGEDYQNISDRLDLSDRAIDKLALRWGNNQILSDIIECDEFDNLMSVINCMKGTSSEKDLLYIDYQEFMITKYFIGILEKLRYLDTKRAFDKMTEKELYEHIVKTHKEYEEAIKRLEEEDKALEERIRSRQEERLKEYDQRLKEYEQRPARKIYQHFKNGGNDNGNNPETE